MHPCMKAQDESFLHFTSLLQEMCSFRSQKMVWWRERERERERECVCVREREREREEKRGKARERVCVQVN